ncbi:hypothetical protein BGW80DRAFT_1295652 [Lactifluus volemus]|nr:hypothetical protein BGW80DRAFT_1295652 [Lactifluus volemus]
MLGQLFLTIAIIALFHGVIIESFVALFFGIIGACIKAPAFKEITWASEMKTRTIDDMDSRMGFANFVTRGKVLGQEEDAKT